MGQQLIILTLALLSSGIGFGILMSGMNCHVPGKTPSVKCVGLCAFGVMVIVATAAAVAFAIKLSA